MTGENETAPRWGPGDGTARERKQQTQRTASTSARQADFGLGEETPLLSPEGLLDHLDALEPELERLPGLIPLLAVTLRDELAALIANEAVA